MKFKPALVALLLTLMVAVPVALLASKRLDLEIVDKQFAFLRVVSGPIHSDDDPLLVGIDEQTYTSFDWPLGLWHPYFGQFLSAMVAAEAKGVMLDVVMPQKPLPNTLAQLADIGQVTYHDEGLLIAIIEMYKRGIPLVIAEAPDESGSRIIRGYSDLLSVLSSLDDVNRFFGMAQVKRDQDGIHRRYTSEIGGRPSLSAQLVNQLPQTDSINVGDGMINYLVGGEVEYVPMQQVSRWLEQGDIDTLKEHFSGRLVLLGAVTTTQDRKPLPLRLFSPTHDQSDLLQPGVMLHLQALRSYLNGGLIHPISLWVSALLGLLSVACWKFSGQGSRALICLLGGGGVLIALSTFLLSRGFMLSISFPLILLTAVSMGRMLFEALLAFRDRQRLKASFSGYVSPSVLSSILSGDISASRTGEAKRVCVLFSDIRQFTSRSENAQPDFLIRLLNRYFEHMVECVHYHGGTVDKFMGDGLMAFFGAPNALPSPAQKSLDAANAMLERLNALNVELKKEGIDTIQIGIGLHVGDVVVGHVGSAGRHEYTAIGDTVNAAARLESLTRDVGYPIVFSEQVYGELQPSKEFIDLGMQALKGRSDMHVYGLKPEMRA
ncbi:MAG: CHASE2 domain-containing protein [Gammaproteobacteria bacterium]|nr:CHASE2 domain-containing protein [Gammaproteobacteria bacterium]